MGLIEGLTALGTLAGIAYMILLLIKKKNPDRAEKIKGLFSFELFRKEKLIKSKDEVQQIWKTKQDMI